MNGDHPSLPYVEQHVELDSTNNRAAQLAADANLSLPALITAEWQTAGRGRGANRWWSSDGALTFSLLIDATEEKLPAARWPLVSLAAALATGDVLTGRLPQHDVRLKWPNDVYVAGRKICGILVEAPPVRPARLIVGIGLNVNNSLREAPADVQARATSMIDEAGQSFPREELLEQITAEFVELLATIASDALPLLERWQPLCLLTGRTVWIDVNGAEVVGRCAGIDATGAILLHTITGKQRLFSGVVKRWE
jgi:BirA family biotin operon repressor/biotin-[acetyl-CoA-carboxylase] ligase